MRQNMTLLQGSVIQRLRDAGFAQTADRANEAWSQGGRLPPVFLTIKPSDRPIKQMDAKLRKDFVRANGHGGGADD